MVVLGFPISIIFIKYTKGGNDNQFDNKEANAFAKKYGLKMIKSKTKIKGKYDGMVARKIN